MIAFGGSATSAASVTIVTPASGTQILVDTPFDSNGAYNAGGFTFNYVYLQVYDVDLITVIVAVNADIPSSGQWTNPTDPLTGLSLLKSPSRVSVGLGATKDFKMKASLYVSGSGLVANATQNLKVNYPAGP